MKFNLKKISVEELETWLGNKLAGRERIDFILFLSVIVYTIVFSFSSILRHYAFNTHAWDLGIFTQSLWTTLNANGFFYHTCELFINPSGAFFGVHFSPILFFIVPLYWISQTPETLLVFQSFILSLAAIPIYKLARENVGGRVVGLVFALAYLMYPPIHHVNLYEFHVQAFLPLFFTYAFYYVTKENWPRYFLFVVLSLMCEDHVALIMFFVGVYIGWRYRTAIIQAIKTRNLAEKKILIPVVTMILSIVWYWFTIWQRNTFFPINPAAMEEFLAGENFKILGATDPLEVPLLVILRPWNAIQALAYDGSIKLLYIVLIFGPLAFFSFRSPSTLIPLIPIFIFCLFSQSQYHHMLGTHYEAYTVSFVFVATLCGLRKNFPKSSDFKSVKGQLKMIVVFSFVFFVSVSPLLPIVSVLPTNYTPAYIGERARLLNEILNKIPSNASILTQNNLFPHVSHRVDAYVVPSPWVNTRIHGIVVDFINQTMDKVEYVLVDFKSDPVATTLVLSLLEAKPKFTLIASEDNNTILLYRCELR